MSVFSLVDIHAPTKNIRSPALNCLYLFIFLFESDDLYIQVSFSCTSRPQLNEDRFSVVSFRGLDAKVPEFYVNLVTK